MNLFSRVSWRERLVRCGEITGWSREKEREERVSEFIVYNDYIEILRKAYHIGDD